MISRAIRGQADASIDSTLSSIRDLGYTRAITGLTRQQTGLEAAQKSFVTVQELSLFNFIS